MKTSEMREKTTDELRSLLFTWQEDLFNSRFQHYNGQLENTQKLPGLKHDAARARTILRERELGIARRSRVTTPRTPEPKASPEAKETP
jgi:large subunit ribosomal protein L29